MRTLVSLLLLLPVSVQAAEPMSAAEFEAYVNGQTLTYQSGGEAYGAEQYLPGRKVRWAFLGDECVEGEWYESAGDICFVYENREEPQCWRFTVGPSGLIATFRNDPAQDSLYEATRSAEPLACLGPKIGV